MASDLAKQLIRIEKRQKKDGKRRMISTSEYCYEWEDDRTTWVLLFPKLVI